MTSRTLLDYFVLILAISITVACTDDKSTQTTAPARQITELQDADRLKTHAINAAIAFATGRDSGTVAYPRNTSDCDPMEGAELEEFEFGSISHVDDLVFDKRIPAIKSVVKVRCVNRIEAKKYDYFVQSDHGYDAEFNMWRCVSIESGNKYALDGNTIIGFKRNPIISGGKTLTIEEACGFVSNTAAQENTHFEVDSDDGLNVLTKDQWRGLLKGLTDMPQEAWQDTLGNLALEWYRNGRVEREAKRFKESAVVHSASLVLMSYYSEKIAAKSRAELLDQVKSRKKDLESTGFNFDWNLSLANLRAVVDEMRAEASRTGDNRGPQFRENTQEPDRNPPGEIAKDQWRALLKGLAVKPMNEWMGAIVKISNNFDDLGQAEWKGENFKASGARYSVSLVLKSYYAEQVDGPSREALLSQIDFRIKELQTKGFNFDWTSSLANLKLALEEMKIEVTGGLSTEPQEPKEIVTHRAGDNVPLVENESNPSFNCDDATTETEMAICADSALKKLDGELGRVYRRALIRDPLVKESQRKWIKERNSDCEADVYCLKYYTEDRIQYLMRNITGGTSGPNDTTEAHLSDDEKAFGTRGPIRDETGLLGLKHNMPPRYPPAMLRRGIEGRVVLRALVSNDGRPAHIEVDVSSGYAEFDKSAMQAARNWRFDKADTSTTDEWITFPVNFSLSKPR